MHYRPRVLCMFPPWKLLLAVPFALLAFTSFITTMKQSDFLHLHTVTVNDTYLQYHRHRSLWDYI